LINEYSKFQEKKKKKKKIISTMIVTNYKRMITYLSTYKRMIDQAVDPTLKASWIVDEI